MVLFQRDSEFLEIEFLPFIPRQLWQSGASGPKGSPEGAQPAHAPPTQTPRDEIVVASPKDSTLVRQSTSFAWHFRWEEQGTSFAAVVARPRHIKDYARRAYHKSVMCLSLVGERHLLLRFESFASSSDLAM